VVLQATNTVAVAVAQTVTAVDGNIYYVAHNEQAATCGIYVADPEPESVFVITAYELRGKPLFAYRRRLRKKGRR
jgi:hypothetical protein